MTIQITSQAQSKKTLDLTHYSHSVLRVCHFFHKRTNLPRIYPSHATIAKETKLSISTVKRALNVLYDDGIIIRHFLYMQMNEYFLHPFWYDPQIWEELDFFFMKFFKFFSLVFMLSINAKENELLLSLTGNYLFKKTIVHRETTIDSISTIGRKRSAVGYQDAWTGHWIYDYDTGQVNLRRDLSEFSAMIGNIDHEVYTQDRLFFEEDASKVDVGSVDCPFTQDCVEAFQKKENNVKQENLFTQEQLEQLSQFPYEILQYATKIVAGKPELDNKFGYFLKICQNRMAMQTDKEAQPAYGKPTAGKPSSRGNAQYHGTTVLASQDRQKRDSEAQRYQAFLNARKERRLAKLHDMGIDGSTLTDYQIKLALAGEPYHTDDIKKSIAASRFGSVESFKPILQNLIKS